MSKNHIRETYKIGKDGKRETATLSNGHRKYLLGDRSGYASGTQTDYEKAIARRVFNTYLDFTTILDELPEHRRKEIFDIGHPPENDEQEAINDEKANDLQDGLVDMIAFMFLLLESEDQPTGGHDRIRQLRFRSVLESGVSKAVKELEEYEWPWIPSVNVDFNVEVNEPEAVDINRTVDKIAEGNVEELSGAEARTLIQLVDNNEGFPEKSDFGVGGWGDLGTQIKKRREERDDIVTREDMNKFADLPDEKVRKQFKETNDDE